AQHVSPPLTTVHQEFNEMGRRTVALLLAALRGEEVTGDAELIPALVQRASSGPAHVAAVRY
ncbi:substrate-binding domain-containing protein, partial [Rhizobium johnstonii]|uniref:substrate-binding domain-containing protein n=1 Tax=Rhizobium johnstonii TaxID=3019933 RepID=UPI003F9654F5